MGERCADIFDSSLFAPDDEGIAEIAELAMAHVPLLGEVGIAEFVNGPITYTPDMNPLIGPAAGVEGFYQRSACRSASPTPQRPARS